jgi:hypothetical protein
MLWLEQPYSNRCGVVAFAMHLPGRSNVQEVLSAKASWTGVGSGGLRGPRGPTGPRPRDVSATRSIQISQDILSPPLYISYLHSKYVDVVKTNSRPSWFFFENPQSNELHRGCSVLEDFKSGMTRLLLDTQSLVSQMMKTPAKIICSGSDSRGCISRPESKRGDWRISQSDKEIKGAKVWHSLTTCPYNYHTIISSLRKQ